MNEYCKITIDAIRWLSKQKQTQNAVDLAIELTDITCKLGMFEALNNSLETLARSDLSVEIFIALLTSSKPAEDRLESRTLLARKFLDKLAKDQNPRAEALKRFAS